MYVSEQHSFKNYKVLKVLGEGAFSNVFLAEQLSTGQNVAIKILKLEGSGKTDSAEARKVRFRREMELCSGLYHANIVKVLDFGETDTGTLFTVFEYIPGQCLGELIKNEGALSIKRTFKIMAQVLAAISIAHDKGIIHRDLKPDNIMVSEDGTDSVKLLDFGISKFVNEDKDSIKVTLTHDFLGTPAYSAPEQVRGLEINHKVDIFAWGLIFIECLTGENAYNESNKAKLVQKQLSKSPVPMPSSLNGTPLGSFLSWLLQKDPLRRAGNTYEVLKRFNLLKADSLPQSAGYLKAGEKTLYELININKKEYQELTRRKISILNCELKFQGDLSQKDKQFLDCLFLESLELCRSLAENNGAYTAADLGGRLSFYFGYPSPGDFHARSAAKTALDIASSLSQTQKALAVRHDIELVTKISLHTGEITIQKTIDKDKVFGSVLGTAADMCSCASPNTISASREVYKRLNKSFNFHETANPDIYKLTGMREVQSLFSRYKNEQLHGRHSELQQLEAIRMKSLSQGQAVMIQGEAGIGKSRFMAESVTTTSIERSSIYELLCFPENKNSALSPFLDFLKKYFKIGEFDSPEEADANILKELDPCSFDGSEYLSLMYYCMGIQSESFPPLELAPKKQKELFLDYTTKLFFEQILEEKSTLIFDDLHWIDPTSLELLNLMLSKINNYSCIILMSARPEFISPWDTELFSLIKLSGLEQNDVTRMIRSRLGKKKVPEKLIETVIQKVDGNPLFAEEMVKSILIGEHSSKRDVPNTLKELFSNRLERIGEAKLTAQLASVIGQKFTYDLLLQIYPHDEGTLLADLTQLLAEGFIHVISRTNSLEYVFHHALVCDNAYESLEGTNSRKIHRQVAEAIRDVLNNDPVENTEFNPRIRELAHHYLKCEDFEESQKYQYLAGKQVLRLSAYNEAIEYFETSLNCLNKQASSCNNIEMDVRIKLGVCLKTVFGWNDLRAIQEYDRIMKLSEQSGDANIEELAPIIFGRWAAVMMKLEFKKALKLADQYLKLAISSNNFEALMQAHLTMANNLYWVGEIDKADTHLKQSLKYHKDLSSTHLIERVGYEPLTMVYMIQVWCSWNSGKINDAEHILEKALTFTESLKHPFSEAIMVQGAAWHYYHAANIDKCLYFSEKLVKLSNKFSLAFYEGIGLLFKGWAMAKKGKFNEGLICINKANDEYINPDKGKFLNSLYSCVLADVLLCNNESSEAKDLLDSALSIAFRNEEKAYLSEIYRLLGEEALSRNNMKEAEKYISKAICFSSSRNMKTYQLRSLLDLTTLKLMDNDESGVSLLKALLKEFDSKENSPEIIEARELINELL